MTLSGIFKKFILKSFSVIGKFQQSKTRQDWKLITHHILKFPKVAKWDVEFTTVEYIDMQADRQAKTFILKSGAWKELCLKSFGW